MSNEAADRLGAIDCLIRNNERHLSERELLREVRDLADLYRPFRGSGVFVDWSDGSVTRSVAP